jgi:hypothetical protein
MTNFKALETRAALHTALLLGTLASSSGCTSDTSLKAGTQRAGDASASDSTSSGPGSAEVVSHVALPSAAPGIGFDDLQFGPTLQKILAPAGRTGNLDLVNVDTEEITAISGFSTSPDYAGGHDFGTTSAVEGPIGFIFATDRSLDEVHVVDVAASAIGTASGTAAHPDYVGWVEPTGDLATEPDGGQIEVFSVSKSKPPTLGRVTTIPVSGGPESLVIDATRGRAYTSSFVGSTYAIDLASRAIVETWPNGCKLSLGLALDEKRGFAFVGCPEGKAVVLDVANGGAILSTATTGGGVDIVAYGESTGHLYVPSPNDKSLAIFGVSAAGSLTELGTVEGAGAGVAADDRRQAWVTDPVNGALIRIRDGFAPTK